MAGHRMWTLCKKHSFLSNQLYPSFSFRVHRLSGIRPWNRKRSNLSIPLYITGSLFWKSHDIEVHWVRVLRNSGFDDFSSILRTDLRRLHCYHYRNSKPKTRNCIHSKCKSSGQMTPSPTWKRCTHVQIRLNNYSQKGQRWQTIWQKQSTDRTIDRAEIYKRCFTSKVENRRWEQNVWPAAMFQVMKGHEILVSIFVHQAHKVHLSHAKEDCIISLPMDYYYKLDLAFKCAITIPTINTRETYKMFIHINICLHKEDN
jgi:hypothetical protein